MPERISIDIDIGTQRGIQAMALFVQQMEAARTKTAAMAAEINATDLSLGKMSATTTKTTQQSEQLDIQMIKLAQDIKFVDTESKNASTGLQQAAVGAKSFAVSGQSAEMSANGVYNAMKSLALGATGAVTSLLGFQTVIRIFDELNQRLEHAVEMQKELANQKLTLQEQLMPLMANLGAFSQTQQNVVLSMVLRSAQQAAATPEQMMSALKASHAVGFTVDPAKGNPIAQAFARFAARTNIDDETMERLAKEAALQGVKTEAGAEQYLAKLMAGFVKTGTGSTGEYVGYLLRAVEGRRAMGETFEYAAGQYTAAIASDPNLRYAAGTAQQMAMIAQGRDPKAVQALATVAVRQGIIRAPSGREVAAGVTGAMGRLDNDPKVQQAVESMKRFQEQETDLAVREREEEQAHKDQMERYDAEMRRGARTAAGVARMPQMEATRKRTEQVHADRVADFNRTRTHLQEERQRTSALLTKLVGGEIAEKQFVALPLEQKEKVLIAALNGTGGDPTLVDSLVRSGLVTPEELQKVLRMAAPEAQAAGKSAQAAIRGATAAQSTTASRAFEGTIVAGARRASVEEQQRNVAGVGPGESFARTFMAAADEYVKRRANEPESFEFSQQIPYFLNQRTSRGRPDQDRIATLTKASNQAYQKSTYLAQQIGEWWASLPGDVKAENQGVLTELQHIEHELVQSGAIEMYSSDKMNANVMTFATRFGDIRAGIEAKQRARLPTTRPAATTRPATTQPTTAPAAPTTQPSDVAPTQQTFNTTIGAYFVTPGGHLDMPSRGEDFFA